MRALETNRVLEFLRVERAQHGATVEKKSWRRLDLESRRFANVVLDLLLRSIALETAEQIGIPLRQVTKDVRYCGSFYGQSSDGHPNHEAITVDSLIEILRGLPVGVTELACHPAFGEDIEGMYVRERSLELRTLCDPRVRQAIDELGIHLASFADIANISE